MVSAFTMELGADEARLSAARDAVTSLEQVGALCPTCQWPVRADNLIQAVDQDCLSSGSLGNKRSQPLPARLTAPPHFQTENRPRC